MNVEDLPHLVVGACMTVHQTLGPGLLREAYEECLAVELRGLELKVERGQSLSFDYRGHSISGAARLDLVVDDVLLVQVLVTEQIPDLERQKMESLLRLGGLKLGLLVNFQVPSHAQGDRAFHCEASKCRGCLKGSLV
jgi:GxxExxY protein